MLRYLGGDSQKMDSQHLRDLIRGDFHCTRVLAAAPALCATAGEHAARREANRTSSRPRFAATRYGSGAFSQSAPSRYLRSRPGDNPHSARTKWITRNQHPDSVAAGEQGHGGPGESWLDLFARRHDSGYQTMAGGGYSQRRRFCRNISDQRSLRTSESCSASLFPATEPRRAAKSLSLPDRQLLRRSDRFGTVVERSSARRGRPTR